MPNAGSGTHELHVSGTDHRPVAHRVLVGQFPIQDIADDLHVAMAVRAEARARRHAVLIDYPQRTELGVLRIEIVRE